LPDLTGDLHRDGLGLITQPQQIATVLRQLVETAGGQQSVVGSTIGEGEHETLLSSEDGL
jgi:hypothetical protein